MKKDSLLKSLILIEYSLDKFIDATKTEAFGALQTGMSYNLFVFAVHIRSNNFEQVSFTRVLKNSWRGIRNSNWNNLSVK